MFHVEQPASIAGGWKRAYFLRTHIFWAYVFFIVHIFLAYTFFAYIHFLFKRNHLEIGRASCRERV